MGRIVQLFFGEEEGCYVVRTVTVGLVSCQLTNQRRDY